jgi:Protein of unknown function (DUF1360)
MALTPKQGLALGERAQAPEVADDLHPPYGAYAAIAGAFTLGLGLAASAARRLGRERGELTALDLVTLAAATFKTSRTLSRERVASFVRQPFVEGEASTGEDEQPTGEGLRRAIGELVTCPRCVGAWSAAALASSQVVAPRFGRLLTWSLGAAGVNDFLQAGFKVLCAKANELEDEAG